MREDTTLSDFEVRITPLFRPNPAGLTGGPETSESGAIVAEPDVRPVLLIDEADTILVEQYSDLEVEHFLNDGRRGGITITPYNPILETPPFAIKEFECAIWIGYWRPGESISETVLYAQCNVSDDYGGDATVVLYGEDPFAGAAAMHYIRRSDPALNIDAERGRLPAHADSLEVILNAARNTAGQMARGVPTFGLDELQVDDFEDPAAENAAVIEFERGQEVKDLAGQVIGALNGPDVDAVPSWNWPTTCYARLWIHAAASGPSTQGPTELGRNLVPADPDAPGLTIDGDREVIFQRGFNDPNDPSVRVDNCSRIKRDPAVMRTHWHALDASHDYRETAVEADGSLLTGIRVGFIEADFSIERPKRGPETAGVPGYETIPADTTALREIVRANVKAYGRPQPHITCELKYDDLPEGMFHYGHPEWKNIVTPPEGIEVIGGDWYIGDHVMVRAREGFRSFAEIVRIVGARLKKKGPKGHPQIEVDVIPAQGGIPTADPDDPTWGAPPEVEVTAPEAGEVSGDVEIEATATDDTGVASVSLRVDGIEVGFDAEAPYAVTWDSTGVVDGGHVITARAIDVDGNMAVSAPVEILVANGEPAEPGDPPPPGENLIYIDGRHFRLTATGAATQLRGMNMHCNSFVFGQAVFDAIAANGWTDLRLCLQWDDMEPTEGNFSEAAFDFVHTAIERAAIAGLRVRLLALTNSPQWSHRVGVIPTWTYTTGGPASPLAGYNRPSMFCCLVSHGEAYLRKLVQEFGGYENVSGFEPCNEPDDFPASNVQAGTQIMLEWMRDEPASAGKIFWVTNSYSSQSAADAYNDWGAINWTHGDLAATMHTYYAPNSPTDPGWAANGIRRESDPIYWNGYPTEASTWNDANAPALRLHLASWKLLGQTRKIALDSGEDPHVDRAIIGVAFAY